MYDSSLYLGELLFVVGGSDSATVELLSLDHGDDPMPTCARRRQSFPKSYSNGFGFVRSKARMDLILFT